MPILVLTFQLVWHDPHNFCSRAMLIFNQHAKTPEIFLSYLPYSLPLCSLSQSLPFNIHTATKLMPFPFMFGLWKQGRSLSQQACMALIQITCHSKVRFPKAGLGAPTYCSKTLLLSHTVDHEWRVGDQPLSGTSPCPALCPQFQTELMLYPFCVFQTKFYLLHEAFPVFLYIFVCAQHL